MSPYLNKVTAITDWYLYHRCPNLLCLTLSGCGHISDHDVISVLRSCRKLRCLHLENCVRITDGSLGGVAAHGDSLEEVKVDFCRNITQAGLQAVRGKRPGIRLSAERSADMIPDSKPEQRVALRRTLQKVLQFSWARRLHVALFGRHVLYGQCYGKRYDLDLCFSTHLKSFCITWWTWVIRNVLVFIHNTYTEYSVSNSWLIETNMFWLFDSRCE